MPTVRVNKGDEESLAKPTALSSATSRVIENTQLSEYMGKFIASELASSFRDTSLKTEIDKGKVGLSVVWG